MRNRGLSALVLALAAVTGLAGCTAAGPAGQVAVGPDVPVGRSTATITHGGLQRTYHLYRPAQLAEPAALVVMLHGGFGSGAQAEDSYGWDAAADDGHFLVAYPDGLDRAWNVGDGCCGRPAREGVDDVGFLTAMVTAVEGRVRIDPAAVFATGMSNGGIMSYALACRTGVFAAIGPVAASRLGPCPAPRPISVIHIHGSADRNIPYDGGRGEGVAHIDGPPIGRLDADWRAVDRCAAPAVLTAGAVTTSVAPCADGRGVELITVGGAGHQWPGSRIRPGAQLMGADPPSTALDATTTIWAFFAAHHAPAGA